LNRICSRKYFSIFFFATWRSYFSVSGDKFSDFFFKFVAIWLLIKKHWKVLYRLYVVFFGCLWPPLTAHWDQLSSFITFDLKNRLKNLCKNGILPIKPFKLRKIWKKCPKICHRIRKNSYIVIQKNYLKTFSRIDFIKV